ncbi:ferric reductase NAD binding domain-domain-containing protein [Naematelia encephala]|uniref:ferric-chelate reductase (NADPH) n=1 Tax=Naematelia encephala TaxID=71784 RepID=A0A1Y2AZH9_9TREE|nr:ferric reductase NAD binding domain-domain-containing protein [Naematelia encephala]
METTTTTIPLYSFLGPSDHDIHTESNSTSTRPPRHHYYFSRLINLLIVLIILILSLRRLINYLRRRSRYRVWRRWAAIEAIWRNWMGLYTLPKRIYGPENVCDALWTVGYTAVLIFFSIWKTTSECARGSDNLANQLGVMAFSQLPLIIILIQKNNPISALTGITYQKLNYLHRASSRACLLLSWLHCILWFLRIGHLFRAYILWGYMALIGYTLLWITSFRLVRRVAYEFFLVAHIVFTLMFLIGAFFHWYRLGYWVWPALAIWVLDRTIRGIRTVWINGRGSRNRPLGDCKIELLGHDLLRITARRDGFAWKAGQHAFIFAPSVSQSLHEAHPFSIASVPSPEHPEAIFLVRVHSGFTRRLADALNCQTTTSIPIYLEGPYGTVHSLSHCSSVLLVAGGTGVTFTSSIFLSLLLHHTSTSVLKHLHLVWHVRHRADTEWLAPILNHAAELVPDDLRVEVDVYVTKTHESDEPAPPEGPGERLAEEVAPSYFARHFPDTPEGERLLPKVNHALGEGERLLPKAVSIMDEVVECGLTRRALRIVKFHRGRADLEKIVRDDVEMAQGRMQVAVCGPMQLMHSLRKAVRSVNTPEAISKGQQSVDYFEETLGA